MDKRRLIQITQIDGKTGIVNNNKKKQKLIPTSPSVTFSSPSLQYTPHSVPFSPLLSFLFGIVV